MPHDGKYYLFFSRDFCCQGLESTYNIAVGRSDSITGPYVDADGKELLDGGGTPVLATNGGRVGPGGQSVSGNTLAFHYYAEELDGAFRLGLAELEWKDGWPPTHSPRRSGPGTSRAGSADAPAWPRTPGRR